jgi:hypothetical protein
VRPGIYISVVFNDEVPAEAGVYTLLQAVMSGNTKLLLK